MSDEDPHARSQGDGEQRERKHRMARNKSEDLRRQALTAEDYVRNKSA